MPQETPAGDDTLHTQQTSQYLLDKVENPNPRKSFVKDLLTLIKDAVQTDQDNTLMRDFNETISKDSKMMAEVLTADRLIDVHSNQHVNKTNIVIHI